MNFVAVDSMVRDYYTCYTSYTYECARLVGYLMFVILSFCVLIYSVLSYLRCVVFHRTSITLHHLSCLFPFNKGHHYHKGRNFINTVLYFRVTTITPNQLN
jgi:hypothetical protein